MCCIHTAPKSSSSWLSAPKENVEIISVLKEEENDAIHLSRTLLPDFRVLVKVLWEAVEGTL